MQMGETMMEEVMVYKYLGLNKLRFIVHIKGVIQNVAYQVFLLAYQVFLLTYHVFQLEDRAILHILQ